MGGWPYMALHLPAAVGRRVTVVSRPASSAPASGSAKAHAAEQAAIMDAVFGRNRLSRCTSPTAASRSLTSGAARTRWLLAGWPSGCGTSLTSIPTQRRLSTS